MDGKSGAVIHRHRNLPTHWLQRAMKLKWRDCWTPGKELVNSELISLLISMATQHLGRNEPKQGMRLAQIAKAIAARIDDPAGYAFACYREGDAFWRMGELERAIEVKEKCLEWLQREVEQRESSLPPEKFAWLQGMLFQLLYWTGLFYDTVISDPIKALQKYQAMLHYAQRYGNVYSEANALNCIGGNKLGRVRWCKAFKRWKEPLSCLSDCFNNIPPTES
jgi:tetratricopeptide (TPR) repeat protein